ncbi:hypothetical protein CRE_27796 [Caenorhabditis remanei]|uniref:F-box domain-containing protein n=1 Tax=Caenorhabditis remanei TaxID=31234 RepID=E3N5I4_CAERE|nr:hypothetical protein CRE_27796 [Caenorhabditis remanei]
MLSTPQFPLLRLPLVALRHTLRMMGPSDVFLLTLFFKRVRVVAQSIFPRTKPSFYVDYCGDQKVGVLYARFPPKLNIPVLKINFRTKKEELLKKWKIDGEKFRCCFDFPANSDIPLIIISPQDNTKFWKILQTHFSRVFPKTGAPHVAVTVDTMSKVPKSEKVELIEVKESKNRILKTSEVEKFMEIYNPILIYVHPQMEGELSDKSCLLTCENLLISYSRHFSRQNFLNFSGKYLLLQNTILTSEDLKIFLETWHKGTDRHLKVVYVFGNTNFEKEKILEGFDWKPWDKTKRPANYPSRARFISPEDHYDCTNAMDIVRESDGALASIRINPKAFMFYVWIF